MSNTVQQKYRAALDLLWGEAGTWAHDTFMALNATYFGNEVPYRGVVWGLTPHGHLLGHTHRGGRFPGRITLHPALLDPRSDAWSKSGLLGEGYAGDVLLHEMMHALLISR